MNSIRRELDEKIKDEYLLQDDLEWIGKELLDRKKRGESIKFYRYVPFKEDMNGINYTLQSLREQSIHLTPCGVLNDIYEGVGACQEEVPSSDDMDKIKDYAFLKSFCEYANDYMMWSHYADEHKGICIEYDLSRLDDNSIIWNHFYPVVYRNERPQIDLDVETIIKEMELKEYECLAEYQTALLVKGKRWESESEWRVVFMKFDIEEGDVPIDIYFPCVSSIWLGYRISDEHKKQIYSLVEELDKDIIIKEVGLSKSSFELDMCEDID